MKKNLLVVFSIMSFASLAVAFAANETTVVPAASTEASPTVTAEVPAAPEVTATAAPAPVVAAETAENATNENLEFVSGVRQLG